MLQPPGAVVTEEFCAIFFTHEYGHAVMVLLNFERGVFDGGGDGIS